MGGLGAKHNCLGGLRDSLWEICFLVGFSVIKFLLLKGFEDL